MRKKISFYTNILLKTKSKITCHTQSWKSLSRSMTHKIYIYYPISRPVGYKNDLKSRKWSFNDLYQVRAQMSIIPVYVQIKQTLLWAQINDQQKVTLNWAIFNYTSLSKCIYRVISELKSTTGRYKNDRQTNNSEVIPFGSQTEKWL